MDSHTSLTSFLTLALASCAAALPNPKSYVPPGAQCQDYTIPVKVTSDNFPWVGPTWTDNFGMINFASAASSRTDAGFPAPVGAPVAETASYEIGATFCTPKDPNKNSRTILLATHGLGFDRSYWNPSFKPSEYNFVQYAIARGYSVFFYDRLGVGASSKINGFKNQLSIQTAILQSLSASLRQGRYTSSVHAKSIVFVGHSFGSFASDSAIAADPDSPPTPSSSQATASTAATQALS